jgi:hypothetical protein
MMSTGGSVTTVAVLAEDFFEYLKTAKMPLEEQFPPNGGFNLSKDIERQLPATNKPSYELGQTYELDAFSYLQSPKKGALLKLEYPLEKGGVSIKNVVFHNFEQCKIPSAEGDIWTTFVTGLDLGDPDGWHAQQLAVCGKKFIGCTQGKPRKITVVADDYCASKTTDMKTPES